MEKGSKEKGSKEKGSMEGFECSLELEMELPSEENSRIVEQAIAPEASLDYWERSTVGIKRNKKVLTLVIRARDATALRAVVNSFLRWIANSLELIDLAQRR